MASSAKTTNIISLMRTMKGNSWGMVKYQPMWGIPFALCNFYMSLYMKSQGVTDRQIGYLISIGYVTGTIFSLFSGVITDRLGRKRATLISDLISWPGAYLIYLFSNNFWMFAIGAIASSVLRINMVSWNLMIVEDSTDDERVAAYNFNNIVNTAAGILTPICGIVVAAYGVTSAQRVFLVLAIVLMTAMMLLRDHAVVETKIGKEIIERNKEYKSQVKIFDGTGLYKRTFQVLKKNPAIVTMMCIYILFHTYMPIGSLGSLYFAPYVSEFLGLDKSTISILGSVNAVVMLSIMIFINPILNRFNATRNMILSLIIQVVALSMMISIPHNNFTGAALTVGVFSLGYGIFLPFMNTLLAKVTEGCQERAGIYAFNNIAVSIISIVVASISGNLYVINPRSIYIISIVLLIVCFILLVRFTKKFNGRSIQYEKEISEEA